MNTAIKSSPASGDAASPIHRRRAFLRHCALAGAGALLANRAVAAAAEPAVPDTTADIWAAFKFRRSVRKFKPDPVPEADLRRILGAARSAPTSGNQQPWKFLVVREPDRIRRLLDACVQRAATTQHERQSDPSVTREQIERTVRTRLRDRYFSAPVFIVVLTDSRSQYPTYNHWDGPLAAGYLMLAARALGYGTVFITDAIPEDLTMRIFEIPERYTRVCITPIGVPAEWPESPEKKPLDELIAWETLSN